MSIVTKGDIANGAFQFARISGLTRKPTPDDMALFLIVQDDKAAEMLASGLDVNWQYPAEYGTSDPADNSGLSIQLAGAMKKIMAIEIAPLYGKEISQAMVKVHNDGVRALERILVSVKPAQLSSIIPIGSGNEHSFRSHKFYPEPPDNHEAIYAIKGDVLTYEETGFGDWLVDAQLNTVIWEPDVGITVADIVIDERTTRALLTFVKIGGHSVKITATKIGFDEVKILHKNFVITDAGPRNGWST